jgi:hypothetical protein
MVQRESQMAPRRVIPQSSQELAHENAKRSEHEGVDREPEDGPGHARVSSMTLRIDEIDVRADVGLRRRLTIAVFDLDRLPLLITEPDLREKICGAIVEAASVAHHLARDADALAAQQPSVLAQEDSGDEAEKGDAEVEKEGAHGREGRRKL